MRKPGPAASVRLVVFDLDGTLVDSQRDIAEAANALIEELGGALLDVPSVAGMVGDGAALLVRRALEAVGLDPHTPGALARFLVLYGERLLNHTRAYDDVEHVLEVIARRMPIAVLTNKPGDASETILEGLGLRRFVGEVIGGDSVHGRKPDPSGLLALGSHVGAGAADILLVGDSAVDLETARRGGSRICLARYGFGYRPPGPDLQPGEFAIDAPLELLDLVGLMRRGEDSD